MGTKKDAKDVENFMKEKGFDMSRMMSALSEIAKEEGQSTGSSSNKSKKGTHKSKASSRAVARASAEAISSVWKAQSRNKAVICFLAQTTEDRFLLLKDSIINMEKDQGTSGNRAFQRNQTIRANCCGAEGVVKVDVLLPEVSQTGLYWNIFNLRTG